jgi:hypothetical protein
MIYRHGSYSSSLGNRAGAGAGSPPVASPAPVSPYGSSPINGPQQDPIRREPSPLMPPQPPFGRRGVSPSFDGAPQQQEQQQAVGHRTTGSASSQSSMGGRQGRRDASPVNITIDSSSSASPVRRGDRDASPAPSSNRSGLSIGTAPWGHRSTSSISSINTGGGAGGISPLNSPSLGVGTPPPGAKTISAAAFRKRPGTAGSALPSSPYPARPTAAGSNSNLAGGDGAGGVSTMSPRMGPRSPLAEDMGARGRSDSLGVGPQPPSMLGQPPPRKSSFSQNPPITPQSPQQPQTLQPGGYDPSVGNRTSSPMASNGPRESYYNADDGEEEYDYLSAYMNRDSVMSDINRHYQNQDWSDLPPLPLPGQRANANTNDGSGSPTVGDYGRLGGMRVTN